MFIRYAVLSADVDQIAAYLPDNYRVVGSVDGQTVIGFEVDLFTVAAGRLGLKTRWQPAKFDDIIPGVLAGTYQVGVSSFSRDAILKSLSERGIGVMKPAADQVFELGRVEAQFACIF